MPRNWRLLTRDLTPDEAAVLKQTEALLRKAEKLKQEELAEKLEEIVQQLQEGKKPAPVPVTSGSLHERLPAEVPVIIFSGVPSESARC